MHTSDNKYRKRLKKSAIHCTTDLLVGLLRLWFPLPNTSQLVCVEKQCSIFFFQKENCNKFLSVSLSLSEVPVVLRHDGLHGLRLDVGGGGAQVALVVVVAVAGDDSAVLRLGPGGGDGVEEEEEGKGRLCHFHGYLAKIKMLPAPVLPDFSEG